MRRVSFILTILILIAGGCSGQSSPVDTATPVKLPATWTPQSKDTLSPGFADKNTPIPTAYATFTPTPTLQTGNNSINDSTGAAFEGAEGWWLRLPQSSLVHASQTSTGDLLMLVRSSVGYNVILRVHPNGTIGWQRTLEGIQFPTGILETRDGGILIMEYTKLHKLNLAGEPEWTKNYYNSEISRSGELFGPVHDVSSYGDGTQVLGRNGDITILDRDGSALEVDFASYLASAQLSDEVVAAPVPGGSYHGEQESRTVYKLSRRNRLAPAWDIRFDFIHFDISLFPPYFVLGTQDGGALFLGPAPHLMNDGGFAIFAARVDRAGNVLWQRIYRGIYEDDFYAIEANDGGFLIANRHTFFGTTYTGSFLRLTRLDSSGYVLWDRVYGDGTTEIQIKNILERQDEGFYLVGQHGARGENDTVLGISLLFVDSKGLIPGCKYLAEADKADMLAKSPEVRKANRTPNTVQDGEIIPPETYEVEFSLQESSLSFEIECTYPSQLLFPGGSEEDPGERIHSFVNSEGLLIGGVQGDNWYTAVEVSAQLDSIIPYRLYNLSTYVGDIRGQLSSPPERSYCPENTYLRFEQTEGLPFRIGLDASWNALPRIPNEISSNIESYRDLVQNMLKKNGIKNPEIEISNIYQIDLNGDGGNEILILANHYKNGLYREGVSEGDYSLFLLRKLKGDDVVMLPLYERYITNDYPNARAAEIELYGLLDLNGDGVMEILAGEKMSKAYRYHIYDYRLDEEAEVLSLYCGEN